MADALDELPKDVRDEYTYMKVLPDGRICGVHRLMFHWTMHVDIGEIGWEDKYCFPNQMSATKALEDWDGTGDPEGWHRHLQTGRRRNLQTGEEWIAF